MDCQKCRLKCSFVSVFFGLINDVEWRHRTRHLVKSAFKPKKGSFFCETALRLERTTQQKATTLTLRVLLRMQERGTPSFLPSFSLFLLLLKLPGTFQASKRMPFYNTHQTRRFLSLSLLASRLSLFWATSLPSNFSPRIGGARSRRFFLTRWWRRRGSGRRLPERTASWNKEKRKWLLIEEEATREPRWWTSNR